MTDIAAALANVDLGEFEGNPILGTAIDIPNAGGGLHAALKVQPIVLHKGARVKVLLDCEVTTVGFPPVKDTNGVTRTHRLTALAATIVDGAVFEEALATQAEKIRVAQEAAKGIHGLPFDLDDEHDRGEHEALVDGCAKCDAEVAAAADESNVKQIGGRKAAKAKDGE